MVVLELENDLTEEQQELCVLVEDAQQGDRVAFGQLVERYERSVYATAMRRLGNDAEAQELVQEVFVQALRKIDQLREPLRFGGWLRSITPRMAINRAARSRAAISADREVLEATVELGGSITAEHGVGMLRRHDLTLQLDASTIGAMRALKRAWDPKGLLNPGKIWA